MQLKMGIGRTMEGIQRSLGGVWLFNNENTAAQNNYYLIWEQEQ